MKLPMLSVAMACQTFAFTPQGMSQEQKPQPDRPYIEHTETSRLHFMNFVSLGRVDLAASSAERLLSAPLGLSSAETESVLVLRGNVEVSMCSDRGCERGSMVLHADAVDYNENTHELDAHGDVRIEPFRTRPRSTVTPG
jgi:lipopolysaccharide assembly outer membrane protein LptD (OstA)